MSPAEVAAKLDRVRGWLAGSGYGAALFTSSPPLTVDLMRVDGSSGL
jgi:hypothetical protein